jgi:primosomal protein N' (replication factor Y)
MHCHYCGSSYPKLVTCPACGTVNWLEKNFGTEKIEEELENEFPEFKIARMDILAGTQMVVKGLDFEKVSLVGILDADGLLNFADFRVNERAFQLMEQVSGRAGRKNEQGKVMIQAAKVDHPVLVFVQQHDYKRLYDFELDNRKRFFYPPFSRVIKIILKHKIREVVSDAANTIGDNFKKELYNYTVGPAAPVVNRIRNMYIMELLLKLPKDTTLLKQYKKVINNYFNLLHAEKRFKSVVLVADVDPM